MCTIMAHLGNVIPRASATTILEHDAGHNRGGLNWPGNEASQAYGQVILQNL
jgi:hypothetical protein